MLPLSILLGALIVAGAILISRYGLPRMSAASRAQLRTAAVWALILGGVAATGGAAWWVNDMFAQEHRRQSRMDAIADIESYEPPARSLPGASDPTATIEEVNASADRAAASR